MQVKVLFFGVLKDLVGRSMETVDLPEGVRLRQVVSRYAEGFPRLREMMPSVAFSVNQEYSSMDRTLREGDEVAMLPPVSGGSETATLERGRVEIVRDPIDTQALLQSMKRPEDGAAVVFEGVVRNHTRARRTLYLHYEAYESMALKQLQELATVAKARFPVREVALVHRLGRLEIGDTSVLVVVASAHRGPAFEACRWIIDTLKKTVPIWKKEFFEDGAVWADGEPFPEEISGAPDTTGTLPASK